MSRVHHPTLGNSIHARQTRDRHHWESRACLPTLKKMTCRGAANESNRHELSQADGKQPRLGPSTKLSSPAGDVPSNPPPVVIPGDLQENVSSQDQRMNFYTQSHPSSHLLTLQAEWKIRGVQSSINQPPCRGGKDTRLPGLRVVKARPSLWP